MYLPDLSVYTPSVEGTKGFTIGWLSAAQPYPQGGLSVEFLERLWAFCRTRVRQMRGLHACELCSASNYEANTARRHGETIEIGSAEIRVFGSGRRVYAAPNLIYHYVVEHRYRPPEEFISAVLEGPLPQSPEYEALASSYEWYDEYSWYFDQLRQGRLAERLKKSKDAIASIRRALPEADSDETVAFILHLGTANSPWQVQDIMRILTKLDKESLEGIARSKPSLIARGKAGEQGIVYRLTPEATERILDSD